MLIITSEPTCKNQFYLELRMDSQSLFITANAKTTRRLASQMAFGNPRTVNGHFEAVKMADLRRMDAEEAQLRADIKSALAKLKARKPRKSLAIAA